jgi:hypothetical protein
MDDIGLFVNHSADALPTYDCKGSVSVRFSASHNDIEVRYRHSPIHHKVPSIRVNRRLASKSLQAR